MTSYVNYADNRWHHVVATRDTLADRLFLYIDGRLINGVTDTVDDVSNTGAFPIGARSLTPTLLFSGVIDEVRISNVARTF